MFDTIILREIALKKGKITITELRNKIGLTHANLLTHLKRLSWLIERTRDKQTIYLSLNKNGEQLRAMLENIPDPFKLYGKDN